MSKIWIKDFTLDDLNKRPAFDAMDATGIEITEIGDDYLAGTMPVDKNTVQIFRVLHGGMNCVLAETLGSIASNLCIDLSKERAVGQHISASHIRAAFEGETIKGVAKLLHKGRRSHIWIIQIFNEAGKLICDSKLTMSVIAKPANTPTP